jgi:hypothetical protein
MPQVGQAAPSTPALASAHPWRLVAFIRHGGCPFAEHTVKRLRAWAAAHPQVAVAVVSHGAQAPTQQWLAHIGGAEGLQWVHCPQRATHAQWGVGYSGLWHFAGPRSLAGVVALWRQGMRNRTATGTRWQRAAMFLVQGGTVVWRHVPESAEAFTLPPDIFWT